MRYFKNTSWMMSEKVLRIVAALTIGAWVTRYLGPTDFGILSYAQSFVGLFAAFSTLGLDRLLARELVKESEQKYVLLGTSFILQTIGSTILVSLLFISIYFNDNDELTNKIIVIMGLLTFVNSFNIIGAYFQSIVKTKHVVITSIIGLIVFTIIRIVLILNDAPLIYFVYAIAFDTIFLILGAIYVYFRSKQSLFKWKFSKTKAKSLLSDSWPLILNAIFISVYVRIDQVMIKEVMDSESVGQYAAAVTLSQAWYFIPGIIGSSLFPAIVNAKKVSESLYYDRLQKLYDLMVLLSVSIAIAMTFLSDWVVEFMYGSEFYLTGDVLSIHIWAGVFVFLGVSVSKWILTENLQRISSFNLFIGMVSNIILNIIMIPKFGVIGAAFATLISQSISVLFTPLLFKKTRPSFFMMIKALSFTSVLRRVFK
ncbi:flippase [Maribacter sp. 2308TA10-17]|uniref:flippase n=1 Tax=Maribacter sp. 2308TA10-17 TaxID=3386276 RepID=UPI0039BCB007